MKKLFPISILAALLLLSCSSENKEVQRLTTDLQYHELQGKVKTLVIERSSEYLDLDETWDSNPEFIDSLVFDENGVLRLHKSWFDEEHVFSAQPPKTKEFDKHGKLISMTVEGLEYKVIQDSINNRVVVYQQGQDLELLPVIWRLHYNLQGQITQELKLDDENSSLWSRNYTYDDNQILTSTSEEIFGSNIPYLFTYTYDPNGRVIKEYRSGKMDYYITFTPLSGDSIWQGRYYKLPENVEMTNENIKELFGASADSDDVDLRIEVLRRYDEKDNFIYQEYRDYNLGRKTITNRKISYF